MSSTTQCICSPQVANWVWEIVKLVLPVVVGMLGTLVGMHISLRVARGSAERERVAVYRAELLGKRRLIEDALEGYSVFCGRLRVLDLHELPSDSAILQDVARLTAQLSRSVPSKADALSGFPAAIFGYLEARRSANEQGAATFWGTLVGLEDSVRLQLAEINRELVL